jgi:signal transduction histidine kinase
MVKIGRYAIIPIAAFVAAPFAGLALESPSMAEFHSPTVVAQYKWYIVAAAVFCGLQAISIVMLLLNRRQLRRLSAERQKAEEAAHELSGRLINAQEEERSRLARELHDDVTQRLALLAIEAGREEYASSKNGNKSRQTMRESLIRLSEDVHALSHQLHPSILDDLGLSDALKSECKRFLGQGSTRVEVFVQEAPETIPHDVALCLFRVSQEALRNVTRHACASQVRLSLQGLDGGIQLVVRDDGTGLKPIQNQGRPHLGHASMRQRVHLLNGKLRIESLPGRGTTVLAWIPLKVSREPYAHPTG